MYLFLSSKFRIICSNSKRGDRKLNRKYDSNKKSDNTSNKAHKKRRTGTPDAQGGYFYLPHSGITAEGMVDQTEILNQTQMES